jgi:hypothetical protein
MESPIVDPGYAARVALGVATLINEPDIRPKLSGVAPAVLNPDLIDKLETYATPRGTRATASWRRSRRSPTTRCPDRHRPMMSTGADSQAVPSPSRPLKLLPHYATELSVQSACVWTLPALTLAHSPSAPTRVGI